MDLRQGIIFMLMSCYISAYAQNQQDEQEKDNNIETYYDEEYNEADDYSRIHFIELSLQLNDPTGAFERNLDGYYIGFGIDYLLQLSSDTPSFLGVGVDYNYLQNAKLATVDPSDGFPFDHSTTTAMTNWTAIYRHYTGINIWGFQPFVEGRLGVSAIFTSTSVTSTEDPDFSEFDFNNFDASISYAFRVGLHYAVGESVYITGRAGYMSSLSTEYDTKDSELVGDTSSYDFYTRKRSTLDAIRYDLGVTFAF